MGQELTPHQGLDRLPDTVAAYQVVLANVATRHTWRALEGLPDLLEPGEQLSAVARANRGMGTGGVIVALTERRLVIIGENTFDGPLSLPLNGWSIETKQAVLTGFGAILRGHEREIKLKQFLPLAEAHRILVALGATADPTLHAALPDSFPRDPGHPPIAGFSDISVYEDRIIDPELRHLPFNGEVQAMADAAGAIAATRGRNLASKGLGTLAFGPIGLFFMGNAKERTIDTRELYLLVEGPDWAFTQPFNPGAGAGLRAFAQEITVAARKYQQRVNPSNETAAGSSLAQQIREVGELRDEGLLTDAEFEEQKKRLLESA